MRAPSSHAHRADLGHPHPHRQRGVDLIMHAGDRHDPIVLDWLERLAPVMAVSGKGDYGGWQWLDMPRVSGCNV